MDRRRHYQRTQQGHHVITVSIEAVLLRGGDCMTKAELVDKIAEKKPGLTRKQVEVVVNTVLDGIKEALSREDKVEIRGFGSFRIRHRRAKEGRNPKTGETVQVPPKKVPFFKAGKEMREMVDGKF